MQITNMTQPQQELLLEALSRLYVKYDRSSAYWETKAANAKYVVEAEHYAGQPGLAESQQSGSQGRPRRAYPRTLRLRVCHPV